MKRREIVYYLNGTLASKDNTWNFSKKNGYVRTFSYSNTKYPQLSDTEVSFRTINTLIQSGLIKKEGGEIDDSFMNQFFK